MSANIHAGLSNEYGKQRRSLMMTTAFALVCAIDLLVVIVWNDPLVAIWRQALQSILLIGMLTSGFFAVSAKRRLQYLTKASEIVRTSPSKNMVLKTWRKDFFDKRNLYYFDLNTEDGFGAANASYVIISEPDTNQALPHWCEKSWSTGKEIHGEVKAFIDRDTGLLCALQTSDSLAWSGLNVHFCRSDDKERLLSKMQKEKENQLSGESAK